MIHLLLAAALLAAPADDSAKAKQLYEQGQTEFELGHYKDAIVNTANPRNAHASQRALQR